MELFDHMTSSKSPAETVLILTLAAVNSSDPITDQAQSDAYKKWNLSMETIKLKTRKWRIL